MQQSFVDYVKIYLSSGKGGSGVVAWRREKFAPKGGPDGGDGGRGGHVILRANSQLWTLLDLKYRKFIRAEDGQPGSGSLRSGRSGKDVVLEVPLGAVVRDDVSGEVVAELLEEGQEVLLLPGGQGGRGNAFFKSPTHQAPDFAQPGMPGLEMEAIIELKLLADVGLVGFPNAGKSTLLSVLSAAQPKIADYPFTTLVPNLGLVRYLDHRSFVMADIPGIIEGAHEGRGLGLQFLRHIERNSALLFLVPADADDPRAQYQVLLEELRQYEPALLDKPQLLAITKCDLLDAELEQELRESLADLHPVMISAVVQKGLEPLKNQLWQLLNPA
jgi:GTP-binding protein